MGRDHAARLARIDDARIVGVADLRRDAAAELANEHGAASYVDYREMLDRTSPDVVFLCTPAGEHLEQIRFAAERGTNIFCEKPLAANVADAVAAADIVDKHGVLCTVGYQWRYSPAADAAREALGDNPVTLLAGWWYWTIPLVPWIKDKRWGGGQVVDQDTHLIDLMRYLAGDVATVYTSYASNAVPQDELPNWDANTLSLRFAGGAAGSVHSTYALFPGIPDSVGLDVVARETLVRVNLQHAVVFRRDTEPIETPASPDWHISQPFLSAVRHNAPAKIRATARESAKSIAVSLAANYSAVTGRPVDLEDFMSNPPHDAPIMPTESPPAPGAESPTAN